MALFAVPLNLAWCGAKEDAVEQKHIKPDWFGALFYKLMVENAEVHVAERYRDRLRQINVAERAFAVELIALRWIALDLGTTLYWGDGPERVAIIDPFLDRVHQNCDPELESFLAQRICQYAVVLNAAGPHPVAPMGAALARFLFEREVRSDGDIQVIQRIGATEFMVALEGVQNFFDTVTVDW